jgi:hypothetical protein
MKADQVWPSILLSSAIAAGIVALAFPGTTICLVVMAWFLLVCPGMTIVRFLNLREPATEWALAIALSIAIDGIVASLTLFVGLWSPPAILGALIAICFLGVIALFKQPEKKAPGHAR